MFVLGMVGAYLMVADCKTLKTLINTMWIYPAAADREVAWAAPLIPIA
jgi:NADH dehydrogenase